VKISFLQMDEDREKFDLKLQKYYSNQRSSNLRTNLSLKGPETFASLIEDHCVDTLALREANHSARRRISDLESELAEIKAKRDAESSVFQQERRSGNSVLLALSHVPALKPTCDSHLEQNRIGERQAALAIAEHDAILIQQLEEEVVSLRSQHECDAKLVKDATEAITILLKENAEKDSKISDQETALAAMATKVNQLTEHMLSAQLLIQGGIRDHQIVLDYALSNSKPAAERPTIDIPRCSPYRAGPQDNPDRPSSSRTLTMKSQNSPTGTSEYLSSTELKRLSPKGFPCRDSDENIVNHLRIENAELLEMLHKERALLRWQEAALNEVRASAEELTLLEAEEIARLEFELDACTIEKNNWERKCKIALSSMQLLQQQQQQQPLL
jgi:hypothetical protein